MDLLLSKPNEQDHGLVPIQSKGIRSWNCSSHFLILFLCPQFDWISWTTSSQIHFLALFLPNHGLMVATQQTRPSSIVTSRCFAFFWVVSVLDRLREWPQQLRISFNFWYDHCAPLPVEDSPEGPLTNSREWTKPRRSHNLKSSSFSDHWWWGRL